MRYVFILGHNPKLSIAEVLAVLPQAKVVATGNSFLIVENEKINATELINRLGGTIKIGEVIADKVDKKLMVETLKAAKKDNKLNFGLSYYECPKDKLGMDIKTELKKAGISCRLVVGQDKALSSVIVVKNRVEEFLILKGQYLAKTGAVQDFENYGQRDFGRPARDMKSGSMPPKLAQIMINLAQAESNGKIHDPFCGSGTVLQEALLLGYSNVSGSDVSAKAINDTKTNLEWLIRTYQLPATSYQLTQLDVHQLSQQFSGVDAIVTEPYLGPPLRGSETPSEIAKNITELENLYVAAFEQFAEVLNKDGKVVIVFPTFMVGRDVLELQILDKIKNLGFTQLDDGKLIYSREGQRVYRNIKVFGKLD